VNIRLTLVEIRSVTSEIRHRKKETKKKERKTTAVKHKPFGIAMPVGLTITIRAQTSHFWFFRRWN